MAIADEVLLGRWEHAKEGRKDHDAEAQAHARREERAAILDVKVLLAWKQADKDVDAHDASTGNTSDSTDHAEDPAPRVVGDVACRRHGVARSPHPESSCRGARLGAVKDGYRLSQSRWM